MRYFENFKSWGKPLINTYGNNDNSSSVDYSVSSVLESSVNMQPRLGLAEDSRTIDTG